MFKKGESVTQVIPAPIVGTVTGFSVDQEMGNVLVKVEWPDADGSTHEKFFAESELLASPAA